MRTFAAPTILAALLIALTAASRADACIWDANTLRDELETRADVFDLILGQFPHHGAAYWQARLVRLESTLGEGPSQEDAAALWNDLGVAQLKLGRFDEAVASFGKVEELAPGRYETLSNLGVLEKKRGDFAAAADYTRRALAIKPEGHLGLGDHYVKMLDWRAAVAANPSTPPIHDFLGFGYVDGFPVKDLDPRQSAKLVLRVREAIAKGGYRDPAFSPSQGAEFDERRLLALIRADRTFSDAFLVLGDRLYARRSRNLAIWAWLKAKELGHPFPEVIDARLDMAFDWLGQAVSQGENFGLRLHSREHVVQVARDGFAQGRAWVEAFEATEAELTAAASGGDVSFAEVEAALAARGVRRYEPPNVGVTGVRIGMAGIMGFIFGVPILLWVVSVVYRRRRARREASVEGQGGR